MSNLLDLLPERYKNSKEIVEFQEALNDVMSMVVNNRNELLLQLNLDSATWGLALWEKQYGIPIDETKEYSFRRERLKAKMRGTGTSTVDFIRNVATSFVNGEVDVIEHCDQYFIEIKTVSIKGLPPNFTELKSAIEQSKPAHLGIIYTILYNTHRELASFTHAYLNKFTHNDLREKGNL